MTVPPTPKPTLKSEALFRTPPTIVSRLEEDDAVVDEEVDIVTTILYLDA
jgi:hypothetical protein